MMTRLFRWSVERVTLTAFFMLCLFHITIPAYLFSGDSSRVLLINSNDSVEKYRIVQEAFLKSLSYPAETLNLEGMSEDGIIRKLKSVKPDLVYCIGSKAYSLASSFFPDKPVVFSSVINCHRLPMTSNTYGVANELNTRMQLFMFRSVFPDIKKIGMLYSKQFSYEWMKSTLEDAKELEIEIIGGEVTRSSVTTLNRMLPKISALWLIADPLVITDRDQLYQIFEICDKKKIPIFSYNDAFAELGAVLIVSADDPTIGRQAAGIAADILSGNKPEENIQYPAGSDITLNLKKVESYRLDYNQDARGMINTVIK